MIPFNVPYVPSVSKQYVLEALGSQHLHGDGPFTAKASKTVSDLVGGGHVLLTPSCTHALEMASMLANIGPGDEVILPSYTFTSAATAVTKFGATPVFVDIETETKGIDINQVREAITRRTKAISWVNYAGIAPNIEGLQVLAKEFNLLLIEDNAHGLGGTYKGKLLGSFGDFATQSFHATKNIQCGEGGALIINNPKYIERAEIIREKGTDRSKFIRGEIQKYQWVDNGSSYLLAEPLAAILLGQLESFHFIQSKRREITEFYSSTLTNNLEITITKNQDSVYHMFFLEFQELIRDLIIIKMMERGIQLTSHYKPLHNSRFGEKFAKTRNQYPISIDLSSTIIRLPLWVELSKDETQYISDNFIKVVREVFGR